MAEVHEDSKFTQNTFHITVDEHMITVEDSHLKYLPIFENMCPCFQTKVSKSRLLNLSAIAKWAKRNGNSDWQILSDVVS